MNKCLTLFAFLAALFSAAAISSSIPESSRSKKAIEKVAPWLSHELSRKGLKLGEQVFIRIFKEESELEVWMQGNDQNEFKLFKSYPICTFSGELGPKQREGDEQSPEGFYFVKPAQMNPFSRFHLSFNLGYLNSYERYHGRTGSALMVHGNCVSIGCYAMTDPFIEEIYTLTHSALQKGQPFFRVHAFPFKMTSENMKRFENNKWYDFWVNLKEGYDHFESKKTPPNVTHEEGIYRFND